MNGSMFRIFSSRNGLLIRELALGIALGCTAALLPIHAHAQSNVPQVDEDYVSYDSIIQDLNRESNAPAPSTIRAKQSYQTSSTDPFDSIWIHGGVGFATTMQTMSLGTGEHDQIHLNHKGIQASLGIDLFSENWMAEATTRSFGATESSAAQISLKEFDLKIFFKEKTTRKFGYRIGAGLTGRYMSIQRKGMEQIQSTTPASVVTMGLDLFLSDKVSIGADLSTRNAMITETADRSSLDATLRLDTHF